MQIDIAVPSLHISLISNLILIFMCMVKKVDKGVTFKNKFENTTLSTRKQFLPVLLITIFPVPTTVLHT